MIIAIDLDGMLLAFPKYFQYFFKAMQTQDAKVGILTARLEENKDEILDALAEIGIKPDFFVGMPEKMKDINFPQGTFKAVVCNYLQVDVLYDDFMSDDPQMLADFFLHNQGTQPFTSFAYDPDKFSDK